MGIREIFGVPPLDAEACVSLRDLSPGTVCVLLRKMPPKEPRLAENPPEPPPSRVPGGELVSANMLPGGVVLLQEIREDGTPGLGLVVPPEDWSDALAEWFGRQIAKKQGRRRLRLVR